MPLVVFRPLVELTCLISEFDKLPLLERRYVVILYMEESAVWEPVQ